ncbi:MAG: hypothetical protein JST40_08245 [Armatimonadetes bacterium]|nr:hypothetical protein [Armatimonadota bacterium]
MNSSLLNELVGEWRIFRQFPNRTAENTATIDWVLDHHWLRIAMKDVAVPSRYEAHVYITRMVSDGTYSIHWLDTFGGTLPESLGTGIEADDSIVFSWRDEDGELRNTFAFDRNSGTWTSTIEQTGPDGSWSLFCTDTYHRVP